MEYFVICKKKTIIRIRSSKVSSLYTPMDQSTPSVQIEPEKKMACWTPTTKTTPLNCNCLIALLPSTVPTRIPFLQFAACSLLGLFCVRFGTAPLTHSVWFACHRSVVSLDRFCLQLGGEHWRWRVSWRRACPRSHRRCRMQTIGCSEAVTPSPVSG